MLFLTYINIDIQFREKKLVWKTYSIAEALSATKRVKVFNTKDFAKAQLDQDIKGFVIYINSLSWGLMML